MTDLYPPPSQVAEFSAASLASATIAILNGAPVNFTAFAQKTDGNDWSLAYQRVLDMGRNVFMPEGRFLRQKSVTTKGQRIVGAGVTRSVWVIGTADQPFQDMSAQGVDVTAGTIDDTGYGYDGVGFEFYQPNTDVRANVIQYPWAIWMAGVDKPDFGAVRVSLGWNGIYADGCGGIKANRLEVCAFNTPFLIDHAYDTTNIGMLRHWPFGCGEPNSPKALLYTVYQDGLAYSQIGRVDGLDIGLLATFQQRIKFYQSNVGGHEFGTIGRLHLDGTFGRIELNSAYISVGSWYGTTAGLTDFKIQQTGGRLSLGPCSWLRGPGDGGTAGLIQVSSGFFAMQAGGFFENIGKDQPLLAQTGGEVIWTGGEIIGIGNQARTRAVFETTGGRITRRSVRFEDIGSGSGLAASVSNDDAHDIADDALGGWGISLPPTLTKGQYEIDRSFSATPTVSFATVGDFVPTYTTQSTSYRLNGNTVFWSSVVTFNTNAFTSAGGVFKVLPGVPYLPRSGASVDIQQVQYVTFSGPFNGEMQTDGSVLFRTFTSNGGLGNMGVTNVPASKTGVSFVLSGTYIV